MKNYTHLALLLIPFVVFSSCRQVEQCRAFDESLFNNWFPYETGVSYTFIGSDGEREVLVIDEKETTDAYEVDHGVSAGYTAQCEVQGSMWALKDKNKPDEFRLWVHHSQYFAGIESEYVLLEFKDVPELLLDATGNELGGKHERGSSMFEAYKPDVLEANGRTYPDVVEISITNQNEAGRSGYDKIYIARGAGIIGYRTYPHGREFWRE